eukprot:Pgem_evm1s5813
MRDKTPNPKRRPAGFNSWSTGRQNLYYLNGGVLPNSITNRPADSNDSNAELQELQTKRKGLQPKLRCQRTKIKSLKLKLKSQTLKLK